MQFACPQCGRPDDVIGDATPRCLACGTALVKATESYKGLLLAPKFAIERLERVIGTYGYELAQSSGRFKREREAWTSAMYALGLAEMTGREYWVEIETVDQTPDTKVHFLDQSAGHNVVNTQSVEIVDWEEHIDEALDVIKAKCRKQYPSDFCLLVLCRNGKVLDVEMLMREVLSLTVPFAEIWLIGRSSERSATMLRLFPGSLRIEFELARSLENVKRQTGILHRQKRGKSTTFEDLGFTYLPLP